MRALPIHLFTHLLQDVSFSCNAQCHRQTDRQTDRQHYDDNSRSYCMQYYRLKTEPFDIAYNYNEHEH